ncbi:NUDIX domain-containing protein [soil metagenome]
MTSDPLEPFDAGQDLRDAPVDQAQQAGVPLRPKDAATLILFRGGPEPEVLMGRRAPGHVFMASRWVFPGGRIERSDFTAASGSDLSQAAAGRLALQVPARRARALALAAVRETFEETGLMLARRAPALPVAGPWREFRALGALPDLAALTYVGRAITPPNRPRRFDARFFMADASALLHPEPGAGSGELDEIAWLPLAEVGAFELPAITKLMLGEAAQRRVDADRAPPFVRMVGATHVVSRD